MSKIFESINPSSEAKEFVRRVNLISEKEYELKEWFRSQFGRSMNANEEFGLNEFTNILIEQAESELKDKKMIKPEELRIGNLVNPKIGDFEHVATITALGINAWMELDFDEIDLSQTQQMEYGEIEPIPLTPEWLEKFNLTKSKILGIDCWILYEVGDLFLEEMTEGSFIAGLKTEKGASYFAWNIDYVHQLQNLYFALCGTELEIK